MKRLKILEVDQKDENGIAPERETAKQLIKRKHAEWTLGIISFTESSVQPIIVDPFLVAMTLARPDRWFRFSTIAVVTSVLGGLFGYVLGAGFFELFGERVISFYNLEGLFAETVVKVDESAFLFTLLGAFTPLPYKLVVIIAGFLQINIFLFLLASIIGRAGRFYIVGYITKQFGEYALKRYVKRLHRVFAAVAIGVILYALYLLLH